MKGIKILRSTVVFESLDEEISDDTKTASGLYIPKEIQLSRKGKTFSKGRVISFGPDCMHVKANDIIYYGAQSETKAVLEGEEISMINEDAIFAVQENEDVKSE